MKQKLLLIATVLFCSFQANAQNTSKVTGQVNDNNGKALNAITVILHRAKDSSIAKTAVTDGKGHYEMATVKAGSYFVTTSAVSLKNASSAVFEVKDGETATVPAISVQAGGKSLQEVTITSKKPIVEVKADKTILNVEGTINAVGNDAFELLRKSPGVMIDKDDNLSLAGKNGVQVYIDGKPSPLSGADLAAYLKSLNSSQIEAIELITNPSAKYEAAGNAGIINIKLKKNKTFGTNGTATAGYNIGTYAKYNAGVSLNHRNAKINAFGSYNFNKGINESNFKLYREQLDSVFNQTNRILQRNKYSHNFKAGIDFFLTKNSTFGVVANGNIADNLVETKGPMYIIFAPTGVVDRTLLASSDNATKRSNMNFNANYRYAVTGGKELNIDADYSFFNIRNNQFQPNDYYQGTTDVKTNSITYRTVSPTDIDIFAVKADYEQNFKKGRLGLGGKIGFVNTDNDFRRWNIDNSSNESYDKDASNRFRYKENINAVYANYNRAFKGFMLQVGLRVENTVSKGRTTGLKNTAAPGNPPIYEDLDTTVKRNYTDLFPSAALTFNKNPMSQFGITYSRRIDRPVYQDLNPFEFKINDYTYMKGNTQLRPQYTNSFGLTHTYKYKLNTALNYSHVKDIFAQLPETKGSKSFLTKKNLATQDIVSLNISYPFQKKWYSFFVNLNSYYSKYKAHYFTDAGEERKIDQGIAALSYYMQNSFNLGKGYKAELSGFYNSPSVFMGTFKARSMYSIDGGLSKTVLKGKGMLKASVSDIFRTMRFKGTIDYAGQHSEVLARWESRQFKLNFNWRFGNTQVKAARQRKGSAEDENKRTESSGNLGGQ